MVALALSQGAWAAHIKLTPADDFARIVESAKDGDVIELAPGLYKKKLTIRAAITLKGPKLTDDKDRLDAKKAAVIDARGRGSGITVRVPQVVVENVAVINYGKNLYARNAGVRVTDGADRVVLRGLTLKGPGFGIRGDRLEEFVVEDCRIEGVRSMHVLDRGDGVFLNYVKRPKLTGNAARNVRDGFYFENVDESESRNNFFTGAQYGIHWMYTRGDSAYDNVSAGVIGGFALMSSKSIHFENNTARRCVEFGVLLNVCDGCTVKGNRVEGVHNRADDPSSTTRARVSLSTGQAPTTSSATGFRVPTSAWASPWGARGTCSPKTALSTTRSRCATSAVRRLSGAATKRGNYWSTFMAWDFDKDGISDKPYQPNDSLDRIFWIYPEARFLMDSPVVALLRWLAQQFEIDRGKGVTDSFPLMDPVPVTGAREGAGS